MSLLNNPHQNYKSQTTEEFLANDKIHRIW